MAYLPESTKQAIAYCSHGIRTERTDLATVVYAAGPVNLFTITGGNIAMMMLLRCRGGSIGFGCGRGGARYGILTAAPYAVALDVFQYSYDKPSPALRLAHRLLLPERHWARLIEAKHHWPDIMGPDGSNSADAWNYPGDNAVPMTGGATSIIRHQLFWYPMDDTSTVVAS